MDKLVLPNVRKLFIPDPGYTMYDGDLKGADAQVVAWEAEDEDLKSAFRAGIDVHVKNAEDMLGTKFTSLPLGSHARDKMRQDNKVAVHATNYGGQPRGLASRLGWLVHDMERWQARWFSLHPGIKTNFHGKVRRALEKNRTVTNVYGFRRVYFDRIDESFTEALAWIPQSVVALTTYYGAFQLEEKFPQVELYLQTHDSITWQVPFARSIPFQEMARTLVVHTPYSDPLYIPWDIKGGTKSWGELEKLK